MIDDERPPLAAEAEKNFEPLATVQDKNLDAQASATDKFFEPLAATAMEKFGLGYTPEARERLCRAMTARREQLGLATFADYAAFLRREPEEWRNVWPLALTREGVFFRPAALFDVARDLISEWSVMAPERVLRVLSLGCGPGYETSSLAMMLEESGLRAKNWQVELYGLDLSPAAINQAENAVFTEADLQWLTPAQGKKWFTPRIGGFCFKQALAPEPRLAVANAYEPESWPFRDLLGCFDVIFARELTWEAPPQAPRRLAAILLEALAPTGFLFTAPGEFLPDDSGELHLEERGGVTYYRRGLRRMKANPPHRSKKQQRSGRDQAPRPGSLAEAQAALPRRERDLLALAADELAAGRCEAALALAREVMLSALDAGRPSPAAWALAAEIETALGRPELAAALSEALSGLIASSN